MKINFINDSSTSGESNCEVHFFHKVDDDIQLSQSANGLLDKTFLQNKSKGKFLDSFLPK